MDQSKLNLHHRRAYFARHLPGNESILPGRGSELGNTCPACGFPTLGKRGAHEICAICFWQDDGQDDEDADEVYGGPNDESSLTSYRREWKSYFAQLREVGGYPGETLQKLEELMARDDKSDIPQVLELVQELSDWFEEERRTKG